MLRFDIDGSDLAAVLSGVKIAARAVVCVIETETGRSRSEHDTAHSVRRDEGRPFFRRAIHVRRNKLSVPVQLLRSVRVVVNVNDNLMHFFEQKQRYGEMKVVGD